MKDKYEILPCIGKNYEEKQKRMQKKLEQEERKQNRLQQLRQAKRRRKERIWNVEYQILVTILAGVLCYGTLVYVWG